MRLSGHADDLRMERDCCDSRQKVDRQKKRSSPESGQPGLMSQLRVLLMRTHLERSPMRSNGGRVQIKRASLLSCHPSPLSKGS